MATDSVEIDAAKRKLLNGGLGAFWCAGGFPVASFNDEVSYDWSLKQGIVETKL